MRALKERSTQHARDRALALGIFLFLLALYTATFTGAPENPDAEVEYQTTSSLARRGRLDVGGTPEAEALMATRSAAAPMGFGMAPGGPGREERRYSWFGVGQAFAAVPLWFAGNKLARLFPEVEERHAGTTYFGVARSEYFAHLAVGWRNPLLAALTAALLFRASRRVGASAASACASALAYGCATFVWPQARSTLSDVQATLALFAGLAFLLAARDPDASARRTLASCASAGAGLGAAVLTRVAIAPAAALLFCLAAHALLATKDAPPRVSRPAALAALALPFLAAGGLFAATNWLRFGDPLETGYGTPLAGGGFFSGSPVLGAAGLFVSPGKGLLWLAPGCVLAPMGLALLWRRGQRRLCLWVAGVAFVVLAPITLMQGWHGAWTYGPRYILPLLPFVWLPVGLVLDRWARASWRGILVRLALLLGLSTSLPAVLVDYTTHLDLAQQATRIAWPEVPGEGDFERDDARFLHVQWDLRFAAPWAHWRILAHRLRGEGERYPAREIFLLESDASLEPSEERRRGWNHLAWFDLHQRLGVPVWPVCLGLLALFGSAVALFVRGFSAPREGREAEAQGPGASLR